VNDDARLIEAARRGDERAFEALYLRHRDWVAQVARRFGAGDEDALDVVQEVFLYVARKLHGLELRADLRTLLYPAAKHLALKRAARARRQAPIEAAPERAAPAAGTEHRLLVVKLLSELPRKQREVVDLRFLDGMSLEEIARALRIRLGTVKSRLHHALRRLRADVEAGD
jgi:RNA polymerase sigma-70 factor (ECF subfamily)